MPTQSRPLGAIISMLLIALWCCQPKNKDYDNDIANPSSASENIIEVETNSMEFRLPKKIKSGWNTFRYTNNSNETHFFILEKLPPGIRIDNYKNELVPPFMDAFKLFDNGDVEAGLKELEKIPPWFSNVEVAGGVGLISPKSTAVTTIHLDSGIYAMECYIRMPNGMAHAFLGMLEEVVVTGERNENEAPTADFEISVSSVDGISFLDTIPAGTHTFAVNFQDQKQYETLLGHDVNLVQLIDNPSVDSLGNWINAADIKAFRTPAPKGFKFLGGVQDLPAEQTGYFNVNLESGNYILISEVPDAIGRNMIHRFTVN